MKSFYREKRQSKAVFLHWGRKDLNTAGAQDAGKGVRVGWKAGEVGRSHML